MAERSKKVKPEDSTKPTPVSAEVLAERLAWIQKLFWWVAGSIAFVFIGFATWYLPKELKTATDPLVKTVDLQASLEPLKTQLAVLSERLKKQVVAPLEQAIPTPDVAKGISTPDLVARYVRARYVVESAMNSQIPASPDDLIRVRQNMKQTISTHPDLGKPENKKSLLGALLAVDTYVLFSEGVIAVNVPRILVASNEPSNSIVFHAPVTYPGPGSAWLIGAYPTPSISLEFTQEFPEGNAAFIVMKGGGMILQNLSVRGTVSPPKTTYAILLKDAKTPVVVYDVAIENLSQDLTDVHWLKVRFTNCTIIYNGGNLFLGNATFENCRFIFGPDSRSQEFLASIKSQSKGVVLASGL